MKTRGVVLVVGLAALLSASSCKKTPEAEAKSWERNTRRAQELMALYPGFAPAIRAQQAQAQAAMDAAKAISSPEESARRMSEANGLLSRGFVGGLSDLDGKVRKVREKVVSASSAAPAGPEQAATQATVADAQRVLTGVDEALRRGAGDPVGAAAIVKKLEADLSSTTASLDKLLDAAKKRQAAALTPGAGAPTTAAAGAATTAPAQVAEVWKCAYCGRQNEGPSKKCAGCGAAHR